MELIEILNPQNPRSTELEHQNHDYRIIGGTAGCVVASRLAENPNTSVLLIEAGRDNALIENTKMPGGWILLSETSEDWNFTTTPQKNLLDRTVNITHGRVLGGTTSLNATLIARGVQQDYDDWGMKGWSGKEFWQYMNKVENFHSKDWFEHDVDSHGTSGPIHTAPHDSAPITKLLFKSMESQGLPYNPDMFSSGKTSHGCGHAVRTVHDGIRSTAADYTDRTGENLWILTDTLVDKVNITQDDNGLRATSVDIVHNNETRATVKAKNEIIISSGALCSPAILLRSGVGPKLEVESFDIESKVDLPGVGKNLMDHIIIPLFYEVIKPELTNDHLIYCADGVQNCYLEWKEKKTGFLSTVPYGAFAYARLDERLKDSELWQQAERKEGRDPMGLTPSQANIEFFATECYGGPKQFSDFPIGGKSAFAIIPNLFGQRSRGTVTLKNKDPLEKPVIDPNYFSDPLDLLVLSEACRLANEVVMEGEGTKDVVSGAWPAKSNHHTFKTREDWVPFVKQWATTCYHFAGSCKMGPSTDPMAVVDENLRVRGVQGLRVADASIIPVLHGGHPQYPTYAIGEKCAEMIKEAN